jgi:SAM-dependent methyltransferase
MNNYEYCAQWILRSGAPKVLDYGCGAGQTVGLLRAKGCDAYGCDVYFEGGDYSPDVPQEFFGTVIRRMEEGRIPFPDGSFDCVVSNMVMEHVEDIDAVIAEIARVLKPGGIALNLFPDRGVWVESHCRIPFLHRFPKHSNLRVYYAALLSWTGIGARDRSREAPLPWARRICMWLDQWTHYRSLPDLHRTFGKRFTGIRHIEDDWLSARQGRKRLPVFLQRYLVRRIGATAFTCVKRE